MSWEDEIRSYYVQILETNSKTRPKSQPVLKVLKVNLVKRQSSFQMLSMHYTSPFILLCNIYITRIIYDTHNFLENVCRRSICCCCFVIALLRNGCPVPVFQIVLGQDPVILVWFCDEMLSQIVLRLFVLSDLSWIEFYHLRLVYKRFPLLLGVAIQI